MSIIEAAVAGNLSRVKGLLNNEEPITNSIIKQIINAKSDQALQSLKYILENHQGACDTLDNILNEMCYDGYSDDSIMYAIDNLEFDVNYLMLHLIAYDRVELAIHLLRNNYVDRHDETYVQLAVNHGKFEFAIQLIKAGAKIDDCCVPVPGNYLVSVLDALTK